jgi:protein-tyrosine phosphatase
MRAVLAMNYRCIPFSDRAPPREGDIEHCLEALPLAYDFVREELDRERTVLVHCTSGKDRTGLFMCYFLIRESGISVREAIIAVRRARPIALSAEGWEDLANAVLKIALSAEGWEDLANAVLKVGNNPRTG